MIAEFIANALVALLIAFFTVGTIIVLWGLAKMLSERSDDTPFRDADDYDDDDGDNVPRKNTTHEN